MDVSKLDYLLGAIAFIIFGVGLIMLIGGVKDMND